MFVFFKLRGEIAKKRLDDVVAFYSEDKYAMVKFEAEEPRFLYGLSDGKSQTYMTRTTAPTVVPSLKGCCAFFEENNLSQFVSINRNCIANMDKASQISNIPKGGTRTRTLVFTDGFEWVISRKNHKAIRDLFLYRETTA